MKLNPYLNFNGNCEQAIRFYEQALGAKVIHIMPFKGSPVETEVAPEFASRIMHAAFEIAGQAFMASDAMPGSPDIVMNGFSISINTDTAEEADRLFGVLADGGQIKMPIQETFWATRFGMLTDKFGMPWMLNCEKRPA